MNRLKAIRLFLLALLVVLATAASAQQTNDENTQPKKKGLFARLKDKVVSKVGGTISRADSTANSRIDNAVNAKMDDVLGKDDGSASTPQTTNSANTPGKNGTQTQAAAGRAPVSGSGKNPPQNSELDYSTLYQASARPPKPGYSRLPVARNLAIEVKGGYPRGYQPKWRFISYASPLKVKKDDWIYPSATVKSTEFKLSIGDYKGKAVLRIKMYILCECFADIEIGDSLAVITQTPQTFKVTNFQRILNDRATGEPCESTSDKNTLGGSEGLITLSANEAGDLVMSLTIETYTGDKTKRGKHNRETGQLEYRVVPSKLAYKYYAENITVDNEMSPEKAVGIVKAEQEAKQKQKEYMAKTTRQADSLEKLLEKKYPQQCRDCFYSSRGGYVSSTRVNDVYRNGYGDTFVDSHNEYDLNLTTTIKNKCSHPITFVGIQQLYDDVNGYYLKEVTKTMDAGYHYSSDQGIMASVFTSIIGGGSEFNLMVQEKYAVNYASVGAVQWLKVVKGN